MISAIVVNWNGRAYLARCLDALLAQEPRPDEVLLVDNASDDGSREMVARDYPAVQIVDSGGNRGASAARNVGVAAAQHEHCLLLDNDVVLEPGALAALLARLDGRSAVGMVQARSLCGDDPQTVHYDGADLLFIGTLALHNWFGKLQDARPHDGAVGAGIALCFLTKRSVYLDVGGFDERMFILYEDNDFSWRLRMTGREVHVAEEALCLHLGGTVGLSMRTPDAKYSSRRTYLHCRNRWILLGANMRWRTLLITMPAQLGYAALYTVFALSRGNAWAALRGHGAAVLALPHILRRRSIQRRRTVADRDLLVAGGMTPSPGVAQTGLAAGVRRASDRIFAGYWKLTRRICG